MIMPTIKCPHTAEDVATGVPVPSLSAYYAASFVNMAVHCPHCGETHSWDKSSAFLVMVSRAANAGPAGAALAASSPPR
jgi:hypothetical protein